MPEFIVFDWNGCLKTEQELVDLADFGSFTAAVILNAIDTARVLILTCKSARIVEVKGGFEVTSITNKDTKQVMFLDDTLEAYWAANKVLGYHFKRVEHTDWSGINVEYLPKGA